VFGKKKEIVTNLRVEPSKHSWREQGRDKVRKGERQPGNGGCRENSPPDSGVRPALNALKEKLHGNRKKKRFGKKMTEKNKAQGSGGKDEEKIRKR